MLRFSSIIVALNAVGCCFNLTPHVAAWGLGRSPMTMARGCVSTKVDGRIGDNIMIEAPIPTTSRSRRDFFVKSIPASATATAAGLGLLWAGCFPAPSVAAGAPPILTTNKGVKYAIVKDAPAKAVTPRQGDIVAVEYTGYLVNGQVFDSTHSEGKRNALLFKLGSDVVIAGLTDVISNMSVGMKVQAIIPPELAFGDKGICLEDKPDECLIKPGSTLVYDVALKKASIPPP